MNSIELDAELLTVAQIFENDAAAYTIPAYQRNYAWDAAQIEQLIEDVWDAHNQAKAAGGDQEYFLGNLVVTRGQSGEYEVVDGQQRLTTLYLLLTILDEHSRHSYRSHWDRLHYESRPRAAASLRRVVNRGSQETVWDPEAAAEEDPGIHEGYNIIQQYLNQHLELDRTAFTNYLRTQVTMVRAVLPSGTDLNRYFEIMNTRGQQLHQVDIVKARLMSQLPPDEQPCFAWVWDACADMDRYIQITLTRGDPGRRGQIFGTDGSWLRLSSFQELCEEHRGIHNASSLEEPAPGLSLEAALTHYASRDAVFEESSESPASFRSTMDFPAFLMHVLKVQQRDASEGGLDDKQLIEKFDAVLTKLEKPAPGEGDTPAVWVQEFCLKLLKLRNLSDAFILKREDSGTGEDGDWSLQQVQLRPERCRGQESFSYRNTFGELNAEVIALQSMLRVTYTSPRTMHWITRVLRLVDAAGPGEVSAERLTEELRAWTRAKVSAWHSMENRPRGFGIPRIVFTYLDYLILKDPVTLPETRMQEYTFIFRNSVEHFYPQGIDPEQTGAVVSSENLHRLGNLALVSVSMNSKFSNQLPRIKAESYRESIIKQSPKLQLMAEAALTGEGWNDDAVESHHRAMHALLEEDLA